MSTWAPFTGFGDDPSTSIKFTFLRNKDGSLPNWSGGPRQKVETIPGGGVTKVRTTARDPYRISIRVSVDDPDTYLALDAAQGTTATLRYTWGITKPASGHYENIVGHGYLAIPNVRLLRLVDEKLEVDGSAEATAEFVVVTGAA